MSFDEQPDAPIHGECTAEINRLNSALESNQWRPIDTAPIDSSIQVDLWVERVGQVNGLYRIDLGDNGIGYEHATYNEVIHIDSVTHWKPHDFGPNGGAK